MPSLAARADASRVGRIDHEHASRSQDLEQFWAGEFGDAYVGRNPAEIDARAAFWRDLIARFPSKRILEVGCAQGANLRHLADLVPPNEVWGADVNESALAALRQGLPTVNGVWAVGRNLPFRDRHFDLVFTMALLIHVPDPALPMVMSEIVRCSRRWVMCGEYHADQPTEIEYRGHTGVLFKRNYGRLYTELFPELELREEGYLTQEQGFDRVTFQVFERTD